MSDEYFSEIRQNIDPYPLATEVKLIWDRKERLGVIMPIDDDGHLPGEATMINVRSGGYSAPAVVTPYGEVVQCVRWVGEHRLGYWSPEYLLPKDFDITKRPAITISRHSMYMIVYNPESRIVVREGFMFISGDDDPEAAWVADMVPF